MPTSDPPQSDTDKKRLPSFSLDAYVLLRDPDETDEEYESRLTLFGPSAKADRPVEKPGFTPKANLGGSMSGGPRRE